MKKTLLQLLVYISLPGLFGLGCQSTNVQTQSPCNAAPSIILQANQIQAGFRGNSDCGHATDYLSGVSLLVNNASPLTAPFESVGLNFEHIISGHADPRNNFEPRFGKFVASQTSANTVTLTRTANESLWGMETVLTYTLTPSNAIDFEFVATPSQVTEFLPHDYVVFFFASYMSTVESPDGYFFRGYPGPGLPEQWVNTAQAANYAGTTYMAKNAQALQFEEDPILELNLTTQDYPRIAQAFYCGAVSGGMGYQIMFDKLFDEATGEEVRFSNFKWNPTRPAWDFQFVVRRPKANTPYRLRGRMLWQPFISFQHCQNQYDAWRSQVQ